VPFHVYSRQELRNGRFDGMSIRSAPIYDTLLQERGAKTVTMPPPAIYSALERGTVDGYAWPIWGIADFGWHKHTKFRVEPGYFNVVVNLLVNLDRWKALDAAQRGCLTDMAVALEKAWPAWRDEYTAKELATQEAAGIQVVDLGAEFRKRAHDLYWAELENTSPENIRKLKGLLLK
jgi:TRAP-type C4-dicarboxylate transport system substrate-binding protein